MNPPSRSLLVAAGIAVLTIPAWGDERAESRVAANRRFHELAQQSPGLLVPLYIYPANVQTNPAYNRLIELKKKHARVPTWAIINPATGPGQQVDPNYTKAIDRLQGAGVVVLGYVSTEYGRRSVQEVCQDLDSWLRWYPKIQGTFFDEMQYEDTPGAVEHQRRLRDAATARGLWPTVVNPGAATPERFFAADVADVMIVHEGAEYPSAAALQGDYFGGYADYPPWTRGILVHSRAKWESNQFAQLGEYARWLYVTDDEFRDTSRDNPWDQLSGHLEAMFQALEP